MEINERIFFLLDKYHKTAKDLGDYIGVKPSSISAWRNGGSYPSSKHIVRISEFFNVNIEYLFTDKDSIETFLDKDEKELLMTYNKLDRRGQHRVHTIIYEELDRIAFNINKKSDAG